MISTDALRWFKETFGQDLAKGVAGTPFSVDLLVAIAAQETGAEIWAPLRNKLALPELLAICVGDTLDADKGRVAFPRTSAAPRDGAARRRNVSHRARCAGVDGRRMCRPTAKVAKLPHKFCHGYGIFQYDLQFFLTDPDYFLQRRWREFHFSLGKCLEELRAAARRTGLQDRQTLTDLEQVAVAIAYNAGVFPPARKA